MNTMSVGVLHYFLRKAHYLSVFRLLSVVQVHMNQIEKANSFENISKQVLIHID